MTDKKSTITDNQIRAYCVKMGYKLLSIDRISFRYIKPDGSEAALLKAAAATRYTPPLYDDVFFEGLAQLDEAARNGD